MLQIKIEASRTFSKKCNANEIRYIYLFLKIFVNIVPKGFGRSCGFDGSGTEKSNSGSNSGNE